MARTDDEKLALFTKVVDRVLAEPALLQPFTVKLDSDATGLKQTVTEPERSDLRSLLMEVRKLDSPE